MIKLPASKIKKPKAPPPPPTEVKSTKKFKVEFWETAKEGKRIIIYGDTGIGKSSLAIDSSK